MRQRILTSLLLTPLLFFALISEVFLFLFILSICLRIILETNLGINEKNKKIRIIFYFSLILMYFLLIIFSLNNLIIYTFTIIFVSLAISMFLNIHGIRISGGKKINNSQYLLIQGDRQSKILLRETSAIFYIFGISTIFYLYQSASDLKWILVPLVTVFSVDTFSYIFGSIFGKKKIKFLSKISPNKTILGYTSGLFFGFVVFIILNLFLGRIVSSFLFLIILSIIFPLIAIIGDLYASAVKRNFGVKNYGNILPGHGGLLDRLDSVILAIVFMALVKALII
jgi:CDP-diglyceride synthetase